MTAAINTTKSVHARLCDGTLTTLPAVHLIPKTLSVCERLPDVKCTSGPRAARTSTKTETIQHIIKMKQFAVRSVGERASVSGRPPCMVQCTRSGRCAYHHGYLVTSRCAFRTHVSFLKQTTRLHWHSLRPQHCICIYIYIFICIYLFTFNQVFISRTPHLSTSWQHTRRAATLCLTWTDSE